MATLSQGYMLGAYIIGFDNSWLGIAFSVVTALAVTSGYCLVGACWLIFKCEAALQKKAIRWAQYHLVNTCIGIAIVSLATPLISTRIFDKWFAWPQLLLVSPLPLFTLLLVGRLYLLLGKLPLDQDKRSWEPLVLTILIFVVCFLGLGYSFFPYIVPEQMTIVEAASAPESLIIMLVGALIVLPILIGYTALSYWIFRGKATELSYD